jgi:transposase-like protein
MTQDNTAPDSLREAILYFADADKALAFMVEMRWPSGVVCPHCAAEKPSFLKTRRIWKCRDCRKQFSVKVGTVFEDSPLGLDKWLPALWMLANCRNGISSYELARHLSVTQKTGWFMLGRIRAAMKTKSFKKLGGVVEIDETFVGGLAKNMHRGKRAKIVKGRGAHAMTGVVGMIERGEDGKKRVEADVMRWVAGMPMHRAVAKTVEPDATVYTDESRVYSAGVLQGRVHATVDHRAREYVRGQVHTNSVENFWSLLKRAIKGTYVSVDPFHLHRYVGEQVFRYNVQGMSEKGRFIQVARDIVGRRLTYAKLIGAGMQSATT